MDIKISQARKPIFEIEQQKWRGESPDIMQTSIFAGQDMMVIQKSDEEPDLFELHYLGFMSGDIQGVDLAKKKAPEFARVVLNKMAKLIAN